MTNEKLPERIWLTVFTDDKEPHFTMLEWQSSVVRNTQPGDYVATRPHLKVEYVPAAPVVDNAPPQCGMCDTGLVFTEQELAALTELYEHTGLRTAQIIKQALRVYQLHIHGEPHSLAAPTKDESGWLLEKMHNGNVHYIAAESVLQWTEDPNKALRLARREDAEALCTIVEDCEKIAEHGWPAAATAAPQQSDDAPASSPDYEKGFEAGCAFTVATLEDNLWHLNYVFDGRECCRRCALVKPAEGWARPCKGPHELSLRAVVPNTAAPVEQTVYVSEHPVTLHCNTCGMVAVKSFKCPRGDGQLVVGVAPLEQQTFKNTKEAMLYAQRNNIPAVVPVSDPSRSARAAAEEIDKLLASRLRPDVYVNFAPANQEIAAIIERHWFSAPLDSQDGQ